MTTVTVGTVIAAPVERVFEVFTDIEHGAERVSGIERIDVLTVGAFKLGTRWRETRRILGGLDSADMEVTAFERHRGYTITHEKGGTRIDAVFTFQMAARGTRVDVEFALSGSGLPPGTTATLGWAIGDRVRNVIARDLEDLKASLEPQMAGRDADCT
jgi:uncharacterized protein YndB with AHSA1/START domain